mgnify:CR=1 FL=1
MAQHKVGFTKGINKDLTKDKYSNVNYYDANNIKVITSNGLSTGSIENEQGNKLLFSFPAVGARYSVAWADLDTVTIDGNTITFGATSLSNEAIYDLLLADTNIAALVDSNDIYIFFNDTGVYVQAVNPTIPISGTATTLYSSPITNINICGWTRLNEWLIVFTSDSEDVEPTSALCQIWKFKFTSGSRTQIDGASGTALVAPEHLIYNDYLNFSTETYVRDIVANYETDEKGRVYWTDYYNQIRVANVFDTELMSVKTNDLGLISEVTLAKPIINLVGDGNLPYGAHYQYFYKLLDSDGRESIFSTGSQLLDVQEKNSNDTSVDYFDLDSSPANSGEDKSFSITINDIDTDFDIIELYAVIYESLDSPSIYKVDDYTVTGSTMNFLHSTLDNNINIPYAEFMEIGIPFTAKTLEDRDKVLTAGNIKESKFDLDFDARTYRFNTNQKADIYSSAGVLEYDAVTAASILAGTTVIEEDADAVNPTNDDTNDTYNINNLASRQIYQDDGSTVGGTGINISYSFAQDARTGSTGSNALKDADAEDEGYNTCNARVAGSTYSIGVTNLDGTSVTVNLENEFANSKSSQLNANFTGYARGEVYRFGIVFYSKSGQRSYVKWIGDIKMPDPSYGDDYKISDADSLNNVPEDQADCNTTLYNLYPRFTVDISSVQSQISGFEIVRVQRTASDRTRLGTGIIHNFVDYSTGDGSGAGSITAATNVNTIARTYANSTEKFYFEGTLFKLPWSNDSTEELDSLIEVGTTQYGDSGDGTGTVKTTLMLPDAPVMMGKNNTNYSKITDPELKRLNVFHSPSSEFRNYTGFDVNTSTDYIRDYGYYTVTPFVYNDDYQNKTDTSPKNFNNFDVGFLYRAHRFSYESNAAFYQISAEKLLDLGEVILPGDDVLDDITLPLTLDSGAEVEAICNTSYTYYNGSSAGAPFGLGTVKQMLNIKETGVETWAEPASSMTYSATNPGGSWLDFHDADIPTNTISMKEVAYCRQVSNQYGGDSYTTRSKNVYISTGTYQIINNDSATSHTVNSFGGDTNVVSFDNAYMRPYHDWIRDEGQLLTPFPDSTSKMSAIIIYAAECPINTAWRTGEHVGGESQDIINRHRGSIDFNEVLEKGELSVGEDFLFNVRHKQENITRTDYIAKDFLLPDTFKFPNRIRVSRNKIDNELTDSWRNFPANQFDDMDGSLGQIHKLIAFKDQLIFFQDRGVGVLPIAERAVIEDVTGAELVLGDGQLIGKYKYLTETSGTRHQHSVIVSDKGVYYYDSSQQKIYMLQGGALTETLGLSAYFHNNIKEILRDSDDLYKASPIGVHGVYDKRNERILYTFLNGNNIITAADGYYEVGDIISTATGYLQCINQGTYITSEIISSNNFKQLSNYQPGITIGYRERLQAFESFYSYKPGKFLNFDDKLLSVGTDRDTGYVHEEGNYGSFYGNAHDSDITLVVMPNPNVISIFNNLEYYSEITLNKADVVGETLDDLLCWNEHQNTGQITLSVGTIAKRRIRTWRHKFKRDVLTTSNNAISNPRMRNYYMFMKLSYSNNSNKRLVLSDVVISYTPTKM